MDLTIEFIPIKSYTNFYYHIMMAVTLVAFLHTQTMPIDDRRLKTFMKYTGGIFLIFTIIYIGFRPISGIFADMMVYYNRFIRGKYGGNRLEVADWLFQSFTNFSSQFLTAELYFFLIACIYILPLYSVSKKLFKDYWFYGLLMFIGSFSFWSYGTNGMRNGMAGSLFLYGITRDKRFAQVIWLFIAVNIHRSMLLPTMGYIVTHFHNKSRTYYAFWIVCIPLSLGLPGFWEAIFGGLVNDDRAEYLTNEINAHKFKSTGFRWDFLFYSSFGVFAGWYYIFKLKLRDNFYIRLYNTYLFANAFWVLVIRASYSNRFAYLSWFFMAIIIVYPWTKYQFMYRQHQKFGWVMLGYITFTYMMQFVYYAN